MTLAEAERVAAAWKQDPRLARYAIALVPADAGAGLWTATLSGVDRNKVASTRLAAKEIAFPILKRDLTSDDVGIIPAELPVHDGAFQRPKEGRAV